LQQQQEEVLQKKSKQVVAKVATTKTVQTPSPDSQKETQRDPPQALEEHRAQSEQQVEQGKAQLQQKQQQKPQKALYKGGQQQQQERQVHTKHHHVHNHKQKVPWDVMLERQAHTRQAVLIPEEVLGGSSMDSKSNTPVIGGAGMLVAPMGKAPSHSGLQG
jgi:hypothetical protein